MAYELLLRNVAPSLYISALQSAWKSGIQIYDPSIWLYREPEVDEKMMRDADIAHAVYYRTHLIAGREWTVYPHTEGTEAGQAVAQIFIDLVRNIRHFLGARRNLAMAFLSGARYGEILVETRVLTLGDGRKRTWYVPTGIRDIDKRRLRLVRDDWNNPSAKGPGPQGPAVSAQGVSLGPISPVQTHWEYWSVAAENWVKISDEGARKLIKHIYIDDEGSLGVGRGLRDALGWWWYAKEFVFAESLEAVERFAQGIVTAKVAGLRDANSALPNDEIIKEWTAVLADMRARNVLVFDAEDEVEIVQMNGQGWQILGEIRDDLRNTITRLILGADLPTGGGGDSAGSYARAAVEENTTEALVQFDREQLEETLTDDLLGYLWDLNYGNLVDLGLGEEDVPRFSIEQQKKEDPRERTQVITSLLGAGVPILKSDVYEQAGLTLPKEGDPVIEGKPEPAPAGPGLPGGFGIPSLSGPVGEEER